MKDQIMLLGKRACIAFDEFPHKRLKGVQGMGLTNPDLNRMVTQGGKSLLESFKHSVSLEEIESTGQIYQKSPLHKNRYYLLDKFDEHYYNELKAFITEAYSYMGARDVHIINAHTVKEERTDEMRRNAKVDIEGEDTMSSTGVEEKAGGEYADYNRQENKRFEHNATRSTMEGLNVKKSKEAFVAWIKEEQVDVEQIRDDNLRLAVKEYMEKGEFKCSASTGKWKYNTELEEVQKTRTEVDVYLKGVGSDFTKKLGLDIKCNCRITREIHQKSEKEGILEYEVIFE